LYFFLVGNKVDLVHAGHKTREVDLEEAIAFAKEENFDYIETSALTGHSVEAMFRRLIFSVAKLIPDVQNNLDIAALPEGWIIKLPCATDHNNNKDKEGRERAASDDAATTMETTSTSANSYMTSKSPRSLDSRLKSTERRKSAILRVQYLNYWTGELHNEMPYTPAQPTLLHTANPPPPKTKERTSSAASTAAAANKEEPRSTSSRKSVAKSTSSASSHIDMLSDEPVHEENKNNNDDKNNITDDITNRDPTRSNSISESSSRRKQLYREDSKNRERPSIE
jgi:hypothetical protein